MLDTLVIGAGSAGLGAARALHDAGRQVLVLEARARLGGRVWTDHSFGPVPVECGAEFIHGSAVETWRWVERAGAETIAATRWDGRWIALEDGRLAGAAEHGAREDLRQVMALDQALESYSGDDITLAAWLAAYGVVDLARHLADVRMAHAYCATPETLSALTLADEYRDSAHNGEGDFRIAPGYSTILDLIAEGLPIRMNAPIAAITWRDDGATVALESGEQIRARSVVVTLPLALLKAGAVRFDPPLPAEKQRAIAGLAMRPAMKLLYRFAEPFWPSGATFLTLPDPFPVWWVPREGVGLLTCFLTGPRAERAAQLGQPIERGLEHLAQHFGARPHALYQASQVVDWGSDPWARGGYSSPPVGSQGLRAALASPCEPLFFAGEATVTGDSPATVHGALVSGARAATEIGQYLQ